MSNKLKEEIIEKAHMQSVKPLAIQYYNEAKINFADLKRKDFENLSGFMQKEINKLLADKTYSMAPDLEMEPKVVKNKDGVFLTVRSGYFKGREAITFDENFIYLCGWASGCNQTPFILGFINWVDNLKSIIKGQNV